MFLEDSPGHFQQRLNGIIASHARSSETSKERMEIHTSNCSALALRARSK